ncbi:MAG: hypothetical protein AAB495_04610 [Patescibacteria group bacterium]
MALPSQAIEKLVRDPGQSPGGYRQLLLLSGTLFFLALVVYLGLKFGYKPYLDSSVSKLDAQIQKFGQEISKEEQDRITAFYSQLVNLRSLLSSRVAATPAFEVLEHNALPGVYFTKASLNALTGEFALTGIAKTIEEVSRQTGVFERDPNVARVNFSNVSSVSGVEGWQFTMSIFLKPDTLRPSSVSSGAVAP